MSTGVPALGFPTGIDALLVARSSSDISVGEMNSSCKQTEKQRMNTNRIEARPALAEPRGGFSLRRYHW